MMHMRVGFIPIPSDLLADRILIGSELHWVGSDHVGHKFDLTPVC